MTRRRAATISAPSASPGRSVAVRHGLAAALIMVLVAIGYGNSVDGEFHLDDQNVTADSALHLRELSPAGLAGALWHGRPVASLTFALNYYWGEHRVFGYHLVNVAIHAATALALYAFLMLLFDLPRARERIGDLAAPLALGASALWSVHPVQTQAVTYIVQRMTSLAALFYLLALIAYLRGRRARGRPRVLWWGGALGCGALAIGSKEIAATLPVALFVIEWCLCEPDPRTAKRAMAVAGLLAIPILAVAALVVHDRVGGSFWSQLTAHRSVIQSFTLTEHFLTEGRVILHYLTLMVWPHPSRLSIEYDFPISRSWFDPPATAVSWLVIAGLIAAGLWLRRRAPLAAFGILWFFLQLAIESSVIPLDLVFEHRLYLPSMGLAILAASGSAWVWRRWPGRGARWIPAVVAGALVLVWTSWTIERNRVWKTEWSLWTDTVAKAPSNPRALATLALAHRDRGDLDRAVELLRAATRANPEYHHAYGQLGLALIDQGNLDGALAAFQRAHALDPTDPQDTYHLGVIYQKLRRPQEAARAFTDTIRLRPDDAEAHNNLAALHQEAGRWDDALAEYAAAVRLDPTLPQAHYGMARVFTHQGRTEEAIREYRSTIEHNPRHVDAHVALAGLYLARGEKAAAVDTFEAALRLAPDVPEGHYQVGRLLDELGRRPEALAHYRRYVELAPTSQASARAWVQGRVRTLDASTSR